MITGMTIDAGTSLAPAFMLTLNSQDITSNFSDRLISLTMTAERSIHGVKKRGTTPPSVSWAAPLQSAIN